MYNVSISTSSLIFLYIKLQNSGNSTNPDPSTSTWAGTGHCEKINERFRTRVDHSREEIQVLLTPSPALLCHRGILWLLLCLYGIKGAYTAYTVHGQLKYHAITTHRKEFYLPWGVLLLAPAYVLLVRFHQSEDSIWTDLDQWECSTLEGPQTYTVYHILHFGFCGILTSPSHGGMELLGESGVWFSGI